MTLAQAKRFTIAADLAINGASPAFTEPLHVGRPNVGDPAELHRLIDDMFDRRWLTNDGPLVQELEQRIADYVGVEFCVAMTNGTVALEIAMRALGLAGEVIVPSYTFVATAHALAWQGITPIFADIDPVTHMIDPEAVRRLITPQTTGIVGVHLWGRGAPVEELQQIADEHGLQLMFDAAHAFGSSINGQMIGGFGRAEVFSFHATKFFNTFEGGAIVTNDSEIANTAKLMRNFGFSGVDEVIHVGTNGKMTEICAAMGLTNFTHIDSVIAANLDNYHSYCATLADIPGMRVLGFDESERNNFQYLVLEVDESCPVSRNDIVAALRAENVLARKYFWPGCHRMEPYRSNSPIGGYVLPETEIVAEKVVVLPTGPRVDEDTISTIGDIIRCLVGTANAA